MKLSSLLKPSAYHNIYQRFKKFYKCTPKISSNWWVWVLRRTLQPHIYLPIWVGCSPGIKYFLGQDKVDDLMLEHILTYLSRVYFPSHINSLPSECVLIDIGAHHGLFTVAAIGRLPKCHVIAVEPDPNALKYLYKNINYNKLSPRVTVVEQALSSTAGKGMLVNVVGDSCANYLSESNDDNVNGFEVSVTVISEVLGESKPEFVKCNAEGTEYTVIPQILEIYLPEIMVVQIHQRFGTPEDLICHIKNYGYKAEKVLETSVFSWWHFFNNS